MRLGYILFGKIHVYTKDIRFPLRCDLIAKATGLGGGAYPAMGIKQSCCTLLHDRPDMWQQPPGVRGDFTHEVCALIGIDIAGWLRGK